ncbi:MAG TPA: hypothetical protein VGD78_04590 [Chthoniobacterales bacterium]
MDAEYWEKRTALVRGGAVRVLSLSKPEEVDYWRDQLKWHRRNSREIELMTWSTHGTVLRGRAQYGPLGEMAEYVFQFFRSSEGKLVKSGTVAFSKPADAAWARQVIDVCNIRN